MAAPVLIDTDPGIDDALALLMGWSSPEISVEAVTTVAGNVPVEQGTVNVFRLLGLRKPTPRPVIAVGAAEPLPRPLLPAHRYHGEDGVQHVRGPRGRPPGVRRAPAPGPRAPRRHAPGRPAARRSEIGAPARIGPARRPHRGVQRARLQARPLERRTGARAPRSPGAGAGDRPDARRVGAGAPRRRPRR